MLPCDQVFRALEDAGEVNASLAEHHSEKSDAGLSFKVKHEVCYVLDHAAKKRKKAGYRM